MQQTHVANIMEKDGIGHYHRANYSTIRSALNCDMNHMVFCQFNAIVQTKAEGNITNRLDHCNLF